MNKIKKMTTEKKKETHMVIDT